MSLANKVKVRVHTAYFKEGVKVPWERTSCPEHVNYSTERTPYLFVNIYNTYKRQYIRIMKVQILENHGVIPQGSRYRGIDVNGYGARVLPVVIPPKSEWETWIKLGEVGESEGYNDIIVLLSNGRYLTSKKRKNVLPSGEVPGNALV